jgi:hypothetical protein
MDVLTAIITAEGEFTMTSTTEERVAESTASAPAQEPKATIKPSAAPRKPRVAPAKGKSNKHATPAKKAAPPPRKANTFKTEGVREASKTATVLALIRRPKGATLAEIMRATSWQAHSVRGFISGTLNKKMGLTVISAKREEGERAYSIPK